MRCFFHLTSRAEEILDETGIEVADVDEARAEAFRAIDELRREEPDVNRDWDGWEIRAVDEVDRALFVLPLNGIIQILATAVLFTWVLSADAGFI